MAPIPPRISKRQTQPQQLRATSTADVYDELGRPLDSLLRRQKRTDRKQREDITVNRQHAAQYDSDVSKGKLIYRDVFPGRKYKLTLSDTTWMGGSNVVRIGYTYDEEFTQISVTAEAPDNNEFEIDLSESNIAAIDTLEIRLEGADGKVRGYLEDSTETGSIKKAIIEILEKIRDLIAGQESLEDDIRGINDSISSLDDRVTALEDAQPSS